MTCRWNCHHRDRQPLTDRNGPSRTKYTHSRTYTTSVQYVGSPCLELVIQSGEMPFIAAMCVFSVLWSNRTFNGRPCCITESMKYPAIRRGALLSGCLARSSFARTHQCNHWCIFHMASICHIHLCATHNLGHDWHRLYVSDGAVHGDPRHHHPFDAERDERSLCPWWSLPSNTSVASTFSHVVCQRTVIGDGWNWLLLRCPPYCVFATADSSEALFLEFFYKYQCCAPEIIEILRGGNGLP